ncbi:MAG TPA: archaeosine synthase subunit alpha [Desulfobacteria bacterium]|nr:archaeosine synthase subunit alpha [Desulfobacteria bacterium]
MSTFYEVRKRDGAARLGFLSPPGEKKQTPLLFHVESLSNGKDGFEVLSVEDANFSDLFKEDSLDAPRGAVLLPEVHPLFTKVQEAIPSLSVDCYVLSFASAMLYNPREFVRRVIDARNAIPPDVALWAPAIATAENAALLFYMGVDLIDDTTAVMQGYQGIYHTEEGAVSLNELEELPCTCSVCSSLTVGELKEKESKERALLLAKHNTLLLEKELKKAREHIRAGSLREYVELKVRSSPFFTAVLRLLDLEEAAYFERRTPVARNHGMMANTMESLKRIEVKRFASRVQERYEPPDRQVLLILPCSARKPYSRSPSHKKFGEAVDRYSGLIHEVILTSPLGVVPRELEAVYPAAFYDIPVTGYWDAEERAWVSSCLRAYFERNGKNYERIVAHLSGAYKELFSGVADELELDVVYTCDNGEDVTSKEALARLKDRIAELCADDRRLSGFEKKVSMIRAMADYQFGLGAGNALVSRNDGKKLKITGKSPKYTLSVTGDVLARIVPEYGLLALTVEGARRIETFMSAYTVHIGDFLSKGSILAPGVVGAGDEIRVNDEVIFIGEKAFGVGRAKMGGWEMVESRRGVAVDVREVLAITQD